MVNQTVIDVAVGNIIQKNSNDKVTLMGSYFEKGSPFIDNMEIVINQGGDGPSITTKIPYSGYYMELFLGDFNGDDKDEIMVRGEFGGSGGYAIAVIYEYKEGKLIEIFNQDKFSEEYSITAKYLDDYKVLVNSSTLKEYYVYDISNKSKQYLNMVYNENGKANKSEEPIISSINEALPIKLVEKKIYYLFIRQRVVGVSNADTIGYVESFVNLLNNNINVVQMGYYNFGRKDNELLRNSGDLQKIFPLGTIFIPIKDVGIENAKFDLNND